MGLEHWDEHRKRWVLYRTDDEHSEDCEKYPYESIPRRVFLDTNVVNLLVKRSHKIFYWAPILPGLELTAAEDIEALMHVLQSALVPQTADGPFAMRLGRLLVDAPFTAALTDLPDRELIGNAIGFQCDVSVPAIEIQLSARGNA
jgi:hypothetical protein